MTSRPLAGSGERGSATVYAIAAGAFLGLLALLIVQATALIRLQHEVSKAADLAALAATQASVAGRDGCRAAGDLAHRNHATVVRCRMDFDVATVTTRGESKAVWGRRFAFERKARAAPSDYLTE
jgi:secretion/DNA translocation related TadE-like protein